MERLVWETAEELDQKLAQRVRNIRKRRSISQEKRSLSGTGGRRHQKAPVSELNHFFLFFRPFNTHRNRLLPGRYSPTLHP